MGIQTYLMQAKPRIGQGAVRPVNHGGPLDANGRRRQPGESPFHCMLLGNLSLKNTDAAHPFANASIRMSMKGMNLIPAQFSAPFNVEDVMLDVRKLKRITWSLRRRDGSREFSHLYRVAMHAMWELACRGALTAKTALAFWHHDSLENGYIPREKLMARLNGSFEIVGRLSHRHGIPPSEYGGEYMDAVFGNPNSVVAKRHDSRHNLSTLAYILKPDARLAERSLQKGVMFHQRLVKEGMATRKDREILQALKNARPDSQESLLELTYIVHNKGRQDAKVFRMQAYLDGGGILNATANGGDYSLFLPAKEAGFKACDAF